ncbi:sugar kinase [Streptomyces atriruber]|uniref:Sugar kinase n=1 Tax=Streptomyces atriruber TaxID=545121 RepID=A0ABV3BWM7_9ACTN
MIALVTLGEMMVTVSTIEPGPFTPGRTARLSVAGAEATVAIGVGRLGHRTAWMGRVGADPAGDMARDVLRAEGVDVSRTRTEPALPTGLMLRQRRTADRTLASYYRKGLAGSRLAPEDVDEELVAAARVLHVTGITPALGPGPRKAVLRAVSMARSAGVTVSFDVNYRSLLWSREEAAAVLRPVIGAADIVFAGLDEAALFTEAATPDEAALALSALGPRQTVIKLGGEGALALVDGKVVVQPAVPVTAVDPVGAGDAFVAGYLAAHLDGASPADRLHTAAVCGAFSVSVPGDWEGLPRRSELALLAGDDVLR